MNSEYNKITDEIHELIIEKESLKNKIRLGWRKIKKS